MAASVTFRAQNLFDDESDNLAAGTTHFAEHRLVGCKIVFHAIEDQPPHQVGCLGSLPSDQNAGERTGDGLAWTTSRWLHSLHILGIMKAAPAAGLRSQLNFKHLNNIWHHQGFERQKWDHISESGKMSPFILCVPQKRPNF